MSGPKILLRLPPLITEAITTVIPMTGIITPEGITDMVGTPEEDGIGTTIRMVATRIVEIIGALTGPVVVGVAARLDSSPVSPGTRFQGKGPVFPSPFPVPCGGVSFDPSEGLGRSVESGPFWDLFLTIGR